MWQEFCVKETFLNTISGHIAETNFHSLQGLQHCETVIWLTFDTNKTYKKQWWKWSMNQNPEISCKSLIYLNIVSKNANLSRYEQNLQLLTCYFEGKNPDFRVSPENVHHCMWDTLSDIMSDLLNIVSTWCLVWLGRCPAWNVLWPSKASGECSWLLSCCPGQECGWLAERFRICVSPYDCDRAEHVSTPQTTLSTSAPFIPRQEQHIAGCPSSHPCTHITSESHHNIRSN